MALVELSPEERAWLQGVVGQTNQAKALRRAQALLWLNDGEGVEAIAQRLCVSRRTVYYWIERFGCAAESERGRRLADAPRSGRPPTARGIIDPLIDEVLETDPRELGYRATVWTAPLLREYLADYHHMTISQRSVSYALERLGVRWKRPRYDLARCPRTWRQAKGGLNADWLHGDGRLF